MTTVSNTSSSSTSLLSTDTSSASSADSLQDQFLTLLVTQLQNQDPLNPMENAELTSQLAQISTVEGITNLKNTLLSISGQIDTSQSMAAASMIGKGILIPGTSVKLGVDETDASKRVAMPFGVDLQGAAANVTVKITNASGEVVRTIDMGAQEVGVYTIDWDGTNDAGVAQDAGVYTISVAATDAEGATVTAEALSYGQVKSVAYSTEGLRLDMGLDGQTSMLDVRKIIGS